MAPPLVFRLVGIVFASILYGKYYLTSDDNTSERNIIGIYCLIFGLYWRIQFKRTDRAKGILLYPLTASFILCTAFLIILILEVQLKISVSHFFCSDVMALLIFEFLEFHFGRLCIGYDSAMVERRG